MSSQSDSLRHHKDTNEQVFNYQFKMPLGVWTSDATKKTGQGDGQVGTSYDVSSENLKDEIDLAL